MRELFYIARWFRRFYRITNGQWLVLIAVFLLLWTGLLLLMNPAGRKSSDLESGGKRDRWKRGLLQGLNLLLMLLGLAAIVFVTLVRRRTSSHHMVLIPLRPLWGMKVSKSYWHVTVMNIALFVPFACGLSCLMGVPSVKTGDGNRRRSFVRKPARVTILTCLVISVQAEAAQYLFGMGLCEADDVLMNTLGSTLGTIPFCLLRLFMKHWRTSVISRLIRYMRY